MGLTFVIPVSEEQIRERNTNASISEALEVEKRDRISSDTFVLNFLLNRINSETADRTADNADLQTKIEEESDNRMLENSQMKNDLSTHAEDPDCHGGILHKNWIFAKNITVSKSGWTLQYEPNGYNYTNQIAVSESKAAAVPTLTFDIGSLLVAQSAEVCGTCLASDGFIVLWAKKIPTSDLTASLKLSYPDGDCG